ncbi:MAG: arginine--tRNA ligase [Candidatus Micrarchaeota archaeon]|nr:arginine--tRNA ligase [Candidatus Micrarchaeota archaeon]
MLSTAYSQIKQELSEAVRRASSAAGYDVEYTSQSIDFSSGFGDISCSVAFRLSKQHKKSPNAIAEEISSKIDAPVYIEKVDVKNGFINFALKRNEFAAIVLGEKKKPIPSVKSKRVIVEYGGVNPNKPWHIGHLRNALLGDTIANIYEKLGYSIEREDYIDDLGLQMAEVTWWFINKNNKPTKKFDQWLGEEYVHVNKFMSENDIKADISSMLQLMEQDGTYESEIAGKIADMVVRAQYETAFNYKIYHDFMVKETDIIRNDLLKKGLAILEKSKFIKKMTNGDYEDCIVIDLNDIKGLPEEFKGMKETVKVLIRSDGTPTYVAKDIAFHMWKFGIIPNTFKFKTFIDKQPNGKPVFETAPEGKEMDIANADISINIIDVRQSYPQAVVRLAFNAIGRDDVAEGIMHLAYGEVALESGTLSGRKGTWIGFSADDLLAEAQERAEKLIKSKFNFSDEEQKRISSSVALAAVKFEFMRISPEKKIIFSWDRALNFEGNSGPYVQYMYARASRILEQAGKAGKLQIDKMNEQEFALLKLLSKGHEIVEKAAREYRPNVITDYASDLASAFSKFYEASPVLKAESEELKSMRLSITASVRDTIGELLSLLGIEPLQRM